MNIIPIGRRTAYREPRSTSARASAKTSAGLSELPAFLPRPLCFRDGLWPTGPDRLRLFQQRRPTNLPLCLALRTRRGCRPTRSQPDSHSALFSLYYDLASWAPFFSHRLLAQAYRLRLRISPQRPIILLIYSPIPAHRPLSPCWLN